MAYITPRFASPGEKTGRYRYPEEARAILGPTLGGNPVNGAVSFWLTLENSARVYVRLDADECKRIQIFSDELLMRRPPEHEMRNRVYLIDGQHRATVRGWWNGNQWHSDRQTAPLCASCSLSLATVQALYTMAETSGHTWSIDGQTIEHLC